MKISLNTIKRYTDLDITTEALVAKINGQLGGVEGVTDLGERYAGAMFVQIVQCHKHPNADKLNVCFVDDGGVQPDVPRTKDGYVQVVCGAPNVREGMLAVWLPPGASVPASHADAEPFVLGARELRGVLSQGMLASPQELALGDGHDGILEIIDEGAKPGASFAQHLGMDDIQIDIENKMFTHRPDCFGQLGVAREIAGIQHRQFRSPDWYVTLPDFRSGDGVELSVQNEASESVPRFMAVAMNDVAVGPSPLWLQAELVRLGAKPINNIVDATNYVMLLTAQPTHAYDYAKLRGAHLGARYAKVNEAVTLLNHKTYTLSPDDIVIVDGEGPVGLAGVMGGGHSEVSQETVSIVLECATFDMYAIRKTSMRHGLFTDAVTRFNKGQSPLQNSQVLAFLIDLIKEVAGGEVASHVYDDSSSLTPHTAVEVSADFINARLGLSLTPNEITQLLHNVEFEVETKKHGLMVTPPFWRTDISLPEDLVEEVGRLYGFDRLPRVLPSRTTKPTPIHKARVTKELIRQSLARAGGNEVLTYSFVDDRLINGANQDATDAYRLSNALSPQLQSYRLNVLPSLIEKVHTNIKAGYEEFFLFELGKGHAKSYGLDSGGLPVEPEFVDAVYASKVPRAGAAYYRARRILVQLFADLGITDIRIEPYEADEVKQARCFDPRRSGRVLGAEGQVVGYVGELLASVRQAFKLPTYSAAFSIDFEALHQLRDRAERQYRPLSRFPKITQDLSIRVDASISFEAVENIVKATLETMPLGVQSVVSYQPITIYQPEDSQSRTYTFRFEVVSYEQTLRDSQVAPLLDAVAAAANNAFDAIRV